MRLRWNWPKVALLSAVMMIGTPIPAQEPFVVVPDHPGGVAVNGCFRANQNLFGPYRLTFCLERRGTYNVRGGGLNCNGRLHWSTSGRDIFIDVERSSCGRGQAWEAAHMDCRHTGNIFTRIIGQAAGIPALQTLRCNYFPSVPGVGRRTFTATRI